MTAHKTCPHCGYDLIVDMPIVVNDFAMNGAGHSLLYKGERLPLTHKEALICWALLKAYPEYVSTIVLGERIGSDADDVDNSIKVLISRIRSKFRDAGAPPAIATGWHAYIWDPKA